MYAREKEAISGLGKFLDFSSGCDGWRFQFEFDQQWLIWLFFFKNGDREQEVISG